MAKSAHFEAAWGAKKAIFLIECIRSRSFFKIVLPIRATSTFFKKCETESELDHKNHERCNLKLAFLMQIRIKVLGE